LLKRQDETARCARLKIDAPPIGAIEMNITKRSQRTDGEVTHGRILEAAGEVLAKTGFAETTNKMIAAEAGVDLASINYHFGNRNGLYQAVLVEAHRRLVRIDLLDRLAASDLVPEEKLRKLVEFLIDGVGAHKLWPVRVLGRELMSPTSHLQVLQKNETEPKLAIMFRILSEVTGISVRDPALTRCLVSVAAPCIFLLVFGRSRSPYADEILKTPKELLIDHIYHFAIGGLRAIAQTLEYKSSATNSIEG
jgi:AcrR family transcriptional regulator